MKKLQIVKKRTKCMKKSGNFPVVGIIAEYNPFHNGHAYQIARAKELSGADACIVVMSGDFVQRGAPAVFDKYTRAAMALTSGADLVLEMPAVFATSSAEDFAACGVALLRRLGVITHLCFGSECGDIDLLSRIADLLAREPAGYADALREQLRKGMTFPEAREVAFLQYLESGDSSIWAAAAGGDVPNRTYGMEQLSQVLSSPNNILGIEYCKALSRQSSSITPITVTRAGSGYHDVELTDGFASATGIRRTLRQLHPDDWAAELKHQMPGEVLSMLAGSLPLTSEDFSPLLNAALLQLVHQKIPLSGYADVSGELETRILSMLLEFGSFEERIQRLKTKQYTYTRISRALLHLMLGIKKTDIEAGRALDYAPYARVLGFRRDSAVLLTRIKKQSEIPLVTKTADAANCLTPAAYEMIQQDFVCSHMYSSVWNGRYQRPVPNEFSRQIVIV